MKKILGLDLGTNSIGWALIEIDEENKIVRIIGLGSRILPMDSGEIGDFESTGKITSTASQRTNKRSTKRLNQRFILRRDRLHLVLNLLKALPEHYAVEIDFEKQGEKCGQFKENKEPKIAYQLIENSSKYEFYFEDAFNEMIKDLQQVNPNIQNEKGQRIPKDWTLYYLRQKALKEKITLEELAWVLLSYNQKRGYEKLEVEDKNDKINEIVENLELKVERVTPNQDEKGKYYEIQLNDIDNFTYKEYSDKEFTQAGDVKELTKTLLVDEEGNIYKNKTRYTITDIYNLTIKDVVYQKTDHKSKPHQYEIIFDNGWKNKVKKKKYTSQYNKVVGKSFDYIVQTNFDNLQEKKERTFREPNYSEGSNDWTLLKKKTEKEALQFNIKNGDVDKETNRVKHYISPKIYDILKQDVKTGSRTKIIGGMFQVVERKFYREELDQIIETQKEFHKSLEDEKIFNDCVKLLYPNNESHRKTLLKNKKAIQNLLIEDILLFQRDLKSKKSEIADCKYEIRAFYEKVDKNTGKIIEVPKYRKAASVSHPLFQEFRIWDKIHNLKLIEVNKQVEGKKETNVDITKDFLKSEDEYQKLFNFFNNQKTINQKQFLKFCSDNFNLPKKGIVWNYPEDEELKGNETRVSFAFRFKRCGFINYAEFLTQEKEIALWHYLYSVNYKERNQKDKQSVTKFFTNFFADFPIEEEVLKKIIILFAEYPKFENRYGAYSEKALRKLLPFIRLAGDKFTGKFEISTEIQKHLNSIEYDSDKIPTYLKLDKEAQNKRTKEERAQIEQLKQDIYENLWKNSINTRIDDIINKVSQINFDEKEIDYLGFIKNEVDAKSNELAFPKGLFNSFKNARNTDDFTNLNLTQASYLVYGRHSELAQATQWKSPKHIREGIIKELKQHSLNNPVAEKVLREMMQVVADIWEFFGKSEPNYFHKIHIELGRDLKKSAKEKEVEFKRQSKNKIQNERLRNILKEFLSESPYNAIPNNLDHFERLKIVEESVYASSKVDKEFEKLLNKPKISKTQFEKYKLWIEQGYKSPYTGEIISLSNLFNGDKYNIDHIFPQALVTNNSLSNKVVCETQINKEKGDMTGREFILKYGRKQININGKTIAILSDEDYVTLVKKRFSKNKQYMLLSKEIPSGFTNSQLNNARYIARKAMELLSHIVREEDEIEYRSKHVLPVTGAVTSELKKAWRLDQTWKELVSSRFKRLNELTQSELFGKEQKNKEGYTYFDCSLHENVRKLSPDFDIKRIDHRHHALDALIVALCTEEHVALLNNINAGINPKKKNNKKKLEQIHKQRVSLKHKVKYFTPNKENPKNKDWHFLPPLTYIEEGKSNHQDNIVKVDFEFNNKKGYYKDIILNALESSLTTHKQNNRVINKTNNIYQKYNKKGEKVFVEQNHKSPNKYNWSVRRSLGKDTFYGKVNLKLKGINKLHSSLKRIYEDIHIVVDKELKEQLNEIIKDNSYQIFIKKVKEQFENNEIELYYFTNDLKEVNHKVASRKFLDDTFDTTKIETITDTGIQKILKNHLKEFDTVELPYEEALNYWESVLEKTELEFIVSNKDNDFESIDDLSIYLKENDYKYENIKYEKLNVFINEVNNRDFRNEKDNDEKNKYLIIEHPEIAFSPEAIEMMNQSEKLKELNNGKAHYPIKKVRVYTSLGTKISVNDKIEDVKSKQYTVTDAGSNLFVGVYEGVIENKDSKKETKRVFEQINLRNLIELLKQDKNNRFAPLPEKKFDEKQNEFILKFSLSPLDLVYVPTDEELELQQVIDENNPNSKQVHSSIVDITNLSKEQKERIFAVNNFTGSKYYFFPVNHSKGIIDIEVDLGLNPEFDTNKNQTSSADIKKIEKALGLNFNGKLQGSQKNTTKIESNKIIDRCWKLEIDRLGNIIKILK